MKIGSREISLASDFLYLDALVTQLPRSLHSCFVCLFSGNPEKDAYKDNSFDNRCGRKCPPDTVQTKRGAAKKHGKRDAGTGEHDADDTAQPGTAEA